ncbi:hypothetical protein COBT_002373 [Conglomerata obtusa]
MSDVKKILRLILKCQNQTILFQKLYSHLGWILKNEYKLHNFENFDTISSALIYGSIRQKCPLKNFEYNLINCLKKQRQKNKNNKEIGFKILIISLYFYNQSYLNTNLNALAELLHHFIGINNNIDYVIIKFFSKHNILFLYQQNIKKKMQNDIVCNILKMFCSKKLSVVSQMALLPSYINYNVEPNISFFDENNDLLLLKYFESFSLYASHAKEDKFIKNIISGRNDLIQRFDYYLQKNLKQTQELISYEVNDLFIKHENVYETLKMLFNQSTDKVETYKRIMNYCHHFKKSEI